MQIKGRGTRTHSFIEPPLDPKIAQHVTEPDKRLFKLFDFFGNCEYFETEFNYDEELRVQWPKSPPEPIPPVNGPTIIPNYTYQHLGADILATIKEETVGYEGMKIDRMLFDRFADTVREDDTVKEAVEARQWDRAIDHVHREVFNKPEDYFTLPKLRQAVDVDRRVTLREISRESLRSYTEFQVERRAIGGGIRQVRCRLQAGRGPVGSGHKGVLQGLRHQ